MNQKAHMVDQCELLQNANIIFEGILGRTDVPIFMIFMYGAEKRLGLVKDCPLTICLNT